MSKSLILRTCRADSSSKNGFVWPEVGQIAKAPDWDSTPECGNGLHGWLFGQGDHTSSNYLGPDALWIVAEVESDDIIMLGGKCKFPEALVLFKGDQKGATDYLIEHEPRAREVAVIGLTKSVGDKESGQVGALGFLTGGDRSTLTGGDRSTLTGGNRSTLTGGYGSELRIRYWDNKAERYRTVIAYVGEDGIEANIAYRLDDSHKFVRAEQETEEAA